LTIKLLYIIVYNCTLLLTIPIRNMIKKTIQLLNNNYFFDDNFRIIRVENVKNVEWDIEGTIRKLSKIRLWSLKTRDV
jgi:hypothetical protein